MPASGKVVSVNLNSFIDPGLFYHEPNKHWLIIIDVTNPEELKELLSQEKYKELINPVAIK